MADATGVTALSESLQDYLEAVCLLVQRHGVARMKEVAALMGVGKSSVTARIQALAERGLVHYEPYQYVTLTESGQAVGRMLLRRHRVLKRFLMEILGVPEAEAEAVGCKMEHAIKGDVLDRFIRFLNFIETRSAADGAWAQAFQEFRASAGAAGTNDAAEDAQP
ncbi:MAG TPA: metal-dependent transcriptional regulator [Phycisphaerae bacterium]|nr:metal-dependent transcriptional regulator [Phycisphaerae bacterium]